jgi:hypothetical protein
MALEGRHGAGSHSRSIHAAGVELHDTFRVRQAAIANAGVVGVGFNDGHTLDRRLDRCYAGLHAFDGSANRLETVPRRDSDRRLFTSGGFCRHRSGGRRRDRSGGSHRDRLASCHFVFRGVLAEVFIGLSHDPDVGCGGPACQEAEEKRGGGR